MRVGTDPTLVMATLAVVMGLGGSAREADLVCMELHGMVPPNTPSGCEEMITRALRQVRDYGSTRSAGS